MRELYGCMCKSLDRKKQKMQRFVPSASTALEPYSSVINTQIDEVKSLPSEINVETVASIAVNIQPTLMSEQDISRTAAQIQDSTCHEEQQSPSSSIDESNVGVTQEDRSLLEKRLRSQLKYLVHDKENFREAMWPFRRMVMEGFPVHPTTVKRMFSYFHGLRWPFECYEMLQYYRTLKVSREYQDRNGDIHGFLSLYERLCDIVRHVGESGTKESAYELVTAIASDLMQLNRHGRTICYPNFVSAMVDQRWVALGHEFARPFYQQIVDQRLEVRPGWWHHLLTISRRNRQADLPFADVAQRLVFQVGIRPLPNVILHAFDNLYPFTDLDSVETFLQVLLHLQNESNKMNAENQKDVFRYDVDAAILSAVTAEAANQGNSEVCLLVCNYMDSLGLEANEAIFENSICAFASNPFTYQQAFTILSKMEQSGFSVQRPLIRTISTHLR